MTARMPSLDVVAHEVRAEREMLFRHADAVDTKAGVILGFTGAVIAIGVPSLDWYSLIPAAPALVVAFSCLQVFNPDRYPIWELRAFRDRYLRSEPEFTRLRIVDTQIVMAERQLELLANNARRLRRAIRWLAASMALFVVATLVREIWG